MKRAFSLLLILVSINTYGQTTKNEVSKPNDFKYPVLVKLIDGYSNMFRIGLIRYNDFHDVKEDVSDVTAYYSRFLNQNELKDKLFVYFPLSKDSGEMLIVSKLNIVKLDLTYDQALQIIMPNK
jgi:hypothetical protein